MYNEYMKIHIGSDGPIYQIIKMDVHNRLRVEYYPLFDYVTITVSPVGSSTLFEYSYTITSELVSSQGWASIVDTMRDEIILTLNEPVQKAAISRLFDKFMKEGYKQTDKTTEYILGYGDYSALCSYSIEYSTGEVPAAGASQVIVSGMEASISKASWKLPGINEVVKYPCGCSQGELRLRGLIMHLNDDHKDWNRERIADWIDELHDSGQINAEFEPWDEAVDKVDAPVIVSEEWKPLGYTVEDSDIINGGNNEQD